MRWRLLWLPIVCAALLAAQFGSGTNSGLSLPANKTLQLGWVFYDPATAIPATVDPTSIYANRARAITITEVFCETDANTATINIQRDDGTPTDLLSADLVCDVGGQTSCALGCDVNTIQAAEDNLAVGDRLDHVTVSLGTINRLTVVVTSTVD